MTNSPTPDPQSSPKSPLGFDEFIAILVALGAIGTIFFWATSRKPEGFSLFASQPPSAVRESGRQNLLPSSRNATKEVPSAVRVHSARVSSSPKVAAIESVETTQTIAINSKPQAIITPIVVVAPKAKSSSIAKTAKYADVANNFWAAPFIIILTDRGVFRGYGDGTFGANKLMTRAEFAVRLDKAFNKTTREAATDFEDVSSKYWAYDSIREADIAGFIKGYPKDYFRPEKPISRTEAIVAIVSGLDLKMPPNPDKILQRYKDAAEIPEYARPKVAAATQAGLVISSNPQLFKPNQAATRAEVAAFLHQGLVKRGKVKAIESKAIVKP